MATPAQRSAAARIAVNTRWAKCPDRAAATQPMRDGLIAKAEAEVRAACPGLSQAEIDKRVANLLTAWLERARAARRRAAALRAAETRRRNAAALAGKLAAETSTANG